MFSVGVVMAMVARGGAEADARLWVAYPEEEEKADTI